MAASEKQGTVIACIIFSILTVALGISTYLFFNKFQEETLKIAQFKEDALNAKEAQKAAEADLKTLKTVLTSATTTQVKLLTDKHKEDLAANGFAETMTYPEMIEHIAATSRDRSTKLAAAEQRNLDLLKKILEIEGAQESQIAVYKQKFDANTQRLTGIENKFALATTQTAEKVNTVIADFEGIKRDVGRFRTQIAKTVDDKDAKLREEAKRSEELLKELEKASPLTLKRSKCRRAV